MEAARSFEPLAPTANAVAAGASDSEDLPASSAAARWQPSHGRRSVVAALLSLAVLLALAASKAAFDGRGYQNGVAVKAPALAVLEEVKSQRPRHLDGTLEDKSHRPRHLDEDLLQEEPVRSSKTSKSHKSHRPRHLDEDSLEEEPGRSSKTLKSHGESPKREPKTSSKSHQEPKLAKPAGNSKTAKPASQPKADNKTKAQSHKKHTKKPTPTPAPTNPIPRPEGPLCASNGQDCSIAKCCVQPGDKCWEKDKGWATCMAHCEDTEDDPETWTCAELGGYKPPKCSWGGDGCAETKCCKQEGYMCLEADDDWNDCVPWDQCGPGHGATENWTCEWKGPSQGRLEVWAAVDDDNVAGTSLYCFVVVTKNGVVPGGGDDPAVKKGYEIPLMDVLSERGLGIYACDANAIFEGKRADEGEWGSIANIDIFVDIWSQVREAGVYSSHDWTVKVDADAVFFPDRLKDRLSTLRAPKGSPIYLENTDFKFKFMGALEVMNKEAVDLLIEEKEGCRDHLGSVGGEDQWTKSCLDASGSGFMSDYSLLKDKYTEYFIESLSDVNHCDDQEPVAFHPHKSDVYWITCYEVSTGVTKLDDLAGCYAKLPDEPCSMGSKKRHEFDYDADGNIIGGSIQ